MSEKVEVAVPDIGDFTDVPVVEILVAAGDEVEKEAPLVVIESDKASMEVPAPQAGKVAQLQVKVGDKVSEGSVILLLEPSGDGAEEEAPAEAADGAGKEAAEQAPPPQPDSPPQPESPPAPDRGPKNATSISEIRPTGSDLGASAPVERGDVHAQVLVLGSGPGGYTAAFRAADLGLEVVMVERYESLGGVCLNVGCIPSKALLHIAKVIADAEAGAGHGVSFGKPKIDVDKIRSWKQDVVGKLTGGLAGLAKGRKVQVIRGEGGFTGPNMLTVDVGDGTRTISFDNAIIAAGSRATRLPGLPYDDPRVIDSTGALELASIPKRMLIIGGGIIGLEMATVYDALGSRITVVELADQLIPGCDRDLVKPLQQKISGRYEAIHLETLVAEVKPRKDGLQVSFVGDNAPAAARFDAILVAVGREACGAGLGLDTAGVEVSDRGIVAVDEQRRSNVPHIYAIGDVAGAPMLAHKATHEAKVAAETIAGQNVAFDVRGIPSVAYTDPEVAWVGLTETDAVAGNIAYEKSTFPWAASGRALSLDAADGLTKLLFEPGTNRLLGAGIAGPNAGELIAETGLALEMGADAEDIGLTIHAHPTLSETVAFAAELQEGTITDLPPPRKKARA